MKLNDKSLIPAIPIGGMSRETTRLDHHEIELPMLAATLSARVALYNCPASADKPIIYARLERLRTTAIEWEHPRSEFRGFEFWRSVMLYYDDCWQVTRPMEPPLLDLADRPIQILPAEIRPIMRTRMLGMISLAYSYRHSAIRRDRFSKFTLYQTRRRFKEGPKAWTTNPLNIEPRQGIQSDHQPSLASEIKNILIPTLQGNSWQDGYAEFESALLESVRKIIAAGKREAEQLSQINSLLENMRKKADLSTRTNLRILQAACDDALMEMMQYLAGELFRQPVVERQLGGLSLKFNQFLYACHKDLLDIALVFHPAACLLLGSPAGVEGIVQYVECPKKDQGNNLSDLIVNSFRNYDFLIFEEKERQKDRHRLGQLTDNIAVNVKGYGDITRDYSALQKAIGTSISTRIAAEIHMDRCTIAEVATKYGMTNKEVIQHRNKGEDELKSLLS
jgi:hypothetical protein